MRVQSTVPGGGKTGRGGESRGPGDRKGLQGPTETGGGDGVEIISPYHQILSVMMMFAVALAIVAFGLQAAELVAQRKKRKAPTAAREADQSAR